MALRSKEKYNPNSVEKIVNYLQVYHDKGQPIEYEIIVDGFKSVRRTNDIAMFPMFEEFVGPGTKAIEILLYTGSSNNNDKYIFTFYDEPKDGLNGIDIKAEIDEKVQQKQKDFEKNLLIEQLKKDNDELEEWIKDLEKEVEQLQKEKAQWEANQSPLKGILGEFGSSFLESFIRRNPKVMAALPGGEALAGILDEENKRREKEQQLPHPEAEVSFKPKGEQPEQISEEDKHAIAFVNQLKTQFTKEEFDKIIIILDTLAGDKSKIELIINHVNLKEKNDEQVQL